LIRIFLLVFQASLLLAIVPIKPREVGENPGFTGEIAASLETVRGNTEKDNYSGSLRMQYDDNVSSLVWGMLNAAYGEATGVRDTNNVYGHLRFIHDLSGKTLASEAFLQAEMDEFKAIKDRDLAGGGLRVRMKDSAGEWGGFFTGAGLFFEYIGYTTQVDPAERNIRLNSYLAYTNQYSPTTLIAAVIYYQPKIDEWDDYIFSSSARLEVMIYEKLYLGFRITFAHDAAPAIGVKPDDFSQNTLIKYKF